MSKSVSPVSSSVALEPPARRSPPRFRACSLRMLSWQGFALIASCALLPSWAHAAESESADGGADVSRIDGDPVPGSKEARAEELLERGVELRRTDQDAEALVVFRQALELAPNSSRAQAHLGTTYQAIGRWVLADEFLSKALAHTADPYVNRHRKALEQARDFVRDHLGLLEVSGGPAGAEVLLNGQAIGTLPMSEPVRVPVGSYQMEVSLAGHYGVNLPVRISRQALTRELVELLPLSAGGRGRVGAAALPDPGSPRGVELEPSSGAGWVPWTLAGAGVVAAGVGTVALIQRQRHADRWNDDAECLNVAGQTRRSLCGHERTLGLRWQTTAIVSGGAAVALGAAAIWTALAGGEQPGEEQVGLLGCSLGGTSLSCAGRF